MRGREGLPHESDSYRSDTRTHGQEEAPLQKASNFVCTPLIKDKAQVQGYSNNPCTKCLMTLFL